VEMVRDAFLNAEDLHATESDQELNRDAKRFYDLLEASKQPIYDGFKEYQSPLSLVS